MLYNQQLNQSSLLSSCIPVSILRVVSFFFSLPFSFCFLLSSWLTTCMIAFSFVKKNFSREVCPWSYGMHVHIEDHMDMHRRKVQSILRMGEEKVKEKYA